MRFTIALGLLAVSFVAAPAAPVVYASEAAFLAALSSLGVTPATEGFEDDLVWGGVRTTISGGPHTAPAISNLGLAWTANNPSGGVTTGSGPALSGAYGFFCLPHGDFANGVGDGFVVTADAPIVAFGGWFETNTPPAKIVFLLDGATTADFGGRLLSTQHDFYGVIDVAGFSTLEVSETEWGPDEAKYVFADDFTFPSMAATAVAAAAPPAPGLVLRGAAPNPFNPSTTLRYEVGRGANVRLVVYDAAGRAVRTLVGGAYRSAGAHEAVWDGRGDGGDGVPSGVYFARLDAGRFSDTTKLILVR